MVHRPLGARVPVRIRFSALVMVQWVDVKVAVHPESQSTPMERRDPAVKEGKI